MPQEADSERIPLLRGPFHNAYYVVANNERRSFLSLLGYGFIITATLLFSVNLIFYFIESSEVMLPKGDSKIPYEYYLGLKDDWNESGEFEYVIETSPPSDPTFSKLFEEELTEELSYDQLKLAEIVVRNYKGWNPAYYEVRENRYGPKNFTALTTQSHMNGLWFIVWTPKVRVSFVSGDKYNNEDNDGGREMRFIDGNIDDVERLLKCEYEITWTYKYFGEIYRKCSNEESWVKIAHVEGTSEWGMQWFDPESLEAYSIVTKPIYGKNKRMRNVVIRPDSPFPPVLPALYLAYYDRIVDREDPNSLL